MSNPLRRIPSNDKMLNLPEVQQRIQNAGRLQVLEGLREASERLRQSEVFPEPGQEPEWILSYLDRFLENRLKPVLNATGVVLHTNLGRAPLGSAALEQVQQVAQGYCNLEFSLETGQRGKRHLVTEDYLRRLTGAESSVVVNNCAAAMVLILDTLARAKEVIVSRGELIEIGGSFRLPDILERAGATLVEVGTTNKTRIEDFERAITERTGLILSTHYSNFKLVGFTQAPTPEEYQRLGQTHGIPTCFDLGSGALSQVGWGEPIVPEAVGFDLVAFSGDKLLGGPQAGIVVGRQASIERLKKNPLMRALRVDKLVYAALEGTLRSHLGQAEIPVLEMLRRPLEQLRAQAEELAQRLTEALQQQADVRVVEGVSSVGGGSVPGQDLPTFLVEVSPHHHSETEWAERLRRHRPPLVLRCTRQKLLLDPRTLFERDYATVEEAFRWLTTS